MNKKRKKKIFYFILPASDFIPTKIKIPVLCVFELFLQVWEEKNQLFGFAFPLSLQFLRIFPQ